VSRSASRSYRRCLVCALLSAAAALSTGASRLEQAIENVAADPQRRGARVGVHVVALATGRVIYSRQSTDLFTAASNEKLITAATALDALGVDYQFVSGLCASGPVRDGELQGDLVFRGGGDPTIGGRYEHEGAAEAFARWADQLQAQGVRRVTGDVVGDDSFFDRVWYHPAWDATQAWKWHFPSTSALSINDNCVMFTVKPGPSAGAPARVSWDPDSIALTLVNVCKTSTKRHAIWFDRQAGSESVKVGGLVRSDSGGYSHEVTVEDPPSYATATLKQSLERAGIQVDGVARLIRPQDLGRYYRFTALADRRTDLAPVLDRMMELSHNHYAEQVIKTVGAETTGKGSWASGLNRAAQMLERLGFRRGEFSLDDGSGLSRNNRLSPVLLTSLLRHVSCSQHGELYRTTLPVAGARGTLARRLTETPYAGNVRAKTGYLNGVGALSGYATARSGVEVAFSVLVNDEQNPPGSYSMRDTVDPICRAIVDYAE
jgi:D-alanyl-D-alanine carboxypeptidase/D-alanyl-D-alanine-endopeptidase (penicillin-binding protein 4)